MTRDDEGGASALLAAFRGERTFEAEVGALIMLDAIRALVGV